MISTFSFPSSMHAFLFTKQFVLFLWKVIKIVEAEKYNTYARFYKIYSIALAMSIWNATEYKMKFVKKCNQNLSTNFTLQKLGEEHQQQKRYIVYKLDFFGLNKQFQVFAVVSRRPKLATNSFRFYLAFRLLKKQKYYAESWLVIWLKQALC